MDTESTVIGAKSVKRCAADLDPDYQDLAVQEAKRQRVVEKDARQASVGTIRKIVTQQFDLELTNKEEEAREVDKRLNEARVMMDRLRAVIVANYYCHSRDEGKKHTQEDSLPSIHPTAKKHLGKAPVRFSEKAGEGDPPSSKSSQSSGPSTSFVKQESVKAGTSKPVTSPAQSKAAASVSSTPSQSTPPAALEPARKPDPEEELGSSRFTIKRTIVVGNCSRFLLPHQRHSTNPSSHKWMVYVRGPRDKPDVSDILSKVWFFLHPSYKPFDLVEIKEPPFHLSRQGWGEFPVRVQLHFQDPRNKRIDIIHNLVLDKTCTGLQTLGAETVVTVEVVRDPVPRARSRQTALPKLPAPIITETVIKEEPMEVGLTSTDTRKDCRCGETSTQNCVCGKKPENGVRGSQERVEGDAGKACDRNITVKEEPPDHYEMTHTSMKSSSQGSIEHSRPVIKTEPCEEDVTVVKIIQTGSRRISDKRMHGNSRDKMTNSVPVSNESVSNGVNVVNGEMERCDSVGSSHSVNSLQTKTRDQTEKQPTSGPPCLSTVAQNSASGDLNPDRNSGIPVHSNGNRRNSPTDSASQVHAVMTQPQKSVEGSSVRQIQVVQGALPQRAGGSVVSASHIHGSPKPAISDGRVDASKSTSSQAARNSTRTSNVAAQVVKKTMPVVFARQGGAVSLLTGLKQEQPMAAAATPMLSVRPVMKVTAQGLKPVQPTITALPCARPPSVTAVQVVKDPSGSQRPVLLMNPALAACTATVVGNNSVQRPRERSLLQTAARPGIRMLLQKSLLSAASSSVRPKTVSAQASLSVPVPQVSCVRPASRSAQSLLTTSVLSGSSAAGASPATLTPSSLRPGTPSIPYVISQLNNKKVLIKLEADQPAVGVSTVGNQLACLGSEGRSINDSQGGVQLRTPPPVKKCTILSSHTLTAGQKTLGQSSVVNLPTAPGPAPTSSVNIQHTKNLSNTDTAKQGQPNSYLSRTALELARAKAALQGRSLLSKSANQLVDAAMQKTQAAEEMPPPKPRCGRWFSKGLGSCLAQGARTYNTVVQQGTSGGAEKAAAVVAGAGKLEGQKTAGTVVKEKRTVVVKKKASNGVDLSLMGTPVAGLSFNEYSCMASLIKAAVLRHPVLAPVSEKTVHPYSAASIEQWMKWHPVKRNASEWSRAVAVRRYLQRWLGTEETFRGEKLWSTKRIVHWCRRCGLSLNGPGGRPLVDLGPQTEGEDVGSGDRPLASVSDFDGLCSTFHSEDTETGGDDSSEVEIVAWEPSSRTMARSVKEEHVHVGYEPQFHFFPKTTEAQFVQDTAAQVGAKFSHAVLAPGIVSTTAEDMVFAAMLEFASDLLHHACVAASSNTNKQQEGASMTVTSRDVAQAMKSLPTAYFLSSQHCGVPKPPSSAPSPTKR